MPSTHDWINDPLGVVEGMFGKTLRGGTFLSDTERYKRVDAAS